MESKDEKDSYIIIKGANLSDDQVKRVLKLGEYHKKTEITDLFGYPCSFEDFKKGEETVSEILEGIDKDWLDIQKLAYIDNKIGTYINYSPEVKANIKYNKEETMTLWNVLANREGTCAGITQAEQYILNRVGIKSKEVLSKNHAYLLVENIKVPINGVIQNVNTLVDPTWDLTEQRFLDFPMQFGKSYNEMRKLDINNNKDGKFHEMVEVYGHEGFAKKEDVKKAISIDENTIRKVYSSIGIANKAGKFPFESWAKYIKYKLQQEENIDNKMTILFGAFKGISPSYVKAQDETIRVFKKLFKQDLIPEAKAKINKVYNKMDLAEKPLLCVSVETKDGMKIYVSNNEKTEMNKKSEKEFLEQYAKYERDEKEFNPIFTDEDLKKVASKKKEEAER